MTRTRTTIGAFVLTASSFAVSVVHADCGSDSWTVSVDETNMVVSPKSLEVCNGDVVTWITNGSSPFRVIFAVGSPPGSPGQGDNWYSLTIGGTPGNYPYDVKIRGQSLDPSIIIKR